MGPPWKRKSFAFPCVHVERGHPFPQKVNGYQLTGWVWVGVLSSMDAPRAARLAALVACSIIASSSVHLQVPVTEGCSLWVTPEGHHIYLKQPKCSLRIPEDHVRFRLGYSLVPVISWAQQILSTFNNGVPRCFQLRCLNS